VETGGAAAVAKGLIGTWISINLVAGYLALCVSNGAEKPWARIAMRVAGSWIIAISLLVLAFSLRK
jgi:Flp pilus assembly pilin Flp